MRAIPPLPLSCLWDFTKLTDWQICICAQEVMQTTGGICIASFDGRACMDLPLHSTSVRCEHCHCFNTKVDHATALGRGCSTACTGLQ